MISPEQPITVRADQDKRKTASPPYISFLTFTNFLEWIEKEGIPLRFDRSFWQSKFSGSTGPQLISGLRFLGLLEKNKPATDLENVIKAKGDDRKAALRQIVQRSYTAINFDELSRATPSMVAEWFQSYKLEGDTLRKAESFFIKACKYMDIPLSSALRKKARNRQSQADIGLAGHRKRARMTTRALARKAEAQEAYALSEGSDEEAVRERHVSQTRIELASGGEIVLGVTADLFKLSKSDREFVFNLVDLINSYQDKVTAQDDAA
jgi:hypothetical protein